MRESENELSRESAFDLWSKKSLYKTLGKIVLKRRSIKKKKNNVIKLLKLLTSLELSYICFLILLWNMPSAWNSHLERSK
jgi:hypothetical protein